MVALTNLLEAIRGFIELGGDVLWAIMAVLLVMWTLIFERFWFFFRVMPSRRRAILEEWRAREDNRSWYAGRIKEEMVSRLELEMKTNIR
ncbi:MAG: MotA/TolQ/ExbB proton channel family protein, partial [Pseudomonadota bacterium]